MASSAARITLVVIHFLVGWWLLVVVWWGLVFEFRSVVHVNDYQPTTINQQLSTNNQQLISHTLQIALHRRFFLHDEFRSLQRPRFAAGECRRAAPARGWREKLRPARPG